jgi:hypothetical protein
MPALAASGHTGEFSWPFLNGRMIWAAEAVAALIPRVGRARQLAWRS